MRSSAAAISLNRFTEVESQAITSSASAPISGAIIAPTRRGRPIQSALFQLLTSPSPHSRRITSPKRAAVPSGSAPNELPSR